MTTRWILVGMIAIAFLTGGSLTNDILMRGFDLAPKGQEVGLTTTERVQIPAMEAVLELPVPVEELDEYIEEVMDVWNVPGLAIAIVKDDQVILSKGYGVRDVDSGEPVNERTLFAIGSTTKAFTTAALAMLVESGDLSWDDLVIDHLPNFQMFDPWVTRHMGIRDLLTHRSGLERGDLLWYAGQYDRSEIIQRVRYLEPILEFRAQFGYQNIMYTIAGQLVEEITGTSWDSYVRHNIFTPLKMYGTLTSADLLPYYQNVAMPHYQSGGQLHTTPYRNIDVVAPAGSINSSVNDMANWVRMQLNEGGFDGETLLSQNSIHEMHSPQMIIPIGPLSEQLEPETHFNAYGLGWFLKDYHGRKVVFHGGNIDGMSALVSLVPEEHLGLVILTNLDATLAPELVARWTIDRFFGVAEKDWSNIFYDTFQNINAQVQQLLTSRRNERVENTTPSLPLEDYTGIYESDFYGDVTITLSDEGLRFNYGSFTGLLSHWHYDTFSVTWDDPYLQSGVGTFLFNFDVDARGHVNSMTGQDLLEQLILDGFEHVSE